MKITSFCLQAMNRDISQTLRKSSQALHVPITGFEGVRCITGFEGIRQVIPGTTSMKALHSAKSVLIVQMSQTDTPQCRWSFLILQGPEGSQGLVSTLYPAAEPRRALVI